LFHAVHLVTFLEQLNELLPWGTYIGHAYLASRTKKTCAEFGDRKGHTHFISIALYGLRSSGASWHDIFHNVLKQQIWLPRKY